MKHSAYHYYHKYLSLERYVDCKHSFAVRDTGWNSTWWKKNCHSAIVDPHKFSVTQQVEKADIGFSKLQKSVRKAANAKRLL